MDIRLIPAVTVLHHSGTKKKATEEDGKVFRTKGKILHMRHATNAENGKTVITIVTDAPLSSISHLVDNTVIIAKEQN